MDLVKNDRITRVVSVALSVILGVLLISLVANAVTTISTDVVTDGSVNASSTVSIGGLATLYGGATTTGITLLSGETITNTTDGTITFGAAGTIASTSAIKVGDESVPTVNGMTFGYCSFSNTTVAASSTNYFDCTTTPSSALITSASGGRVFVQATSSFDSGFVIEAASSTGVSTINVRVRNLSGSDAAPDTTLGGTSISFWQIY